MNKTLRKSLFFILKICVTLLVISPFYIAIIYSVKSKPEMVTNRLAFPKTIHWDNFTRAIETSNFGLAMKNSLINALYKEDRYTPYDNEAVSFTLDLTVEEQYLDNEQYACQQKKIQEILNILTPRQKEIIYYRYIQELSFEEICIMMDMNYQSAQNLIQRSLKKVRDMYGSIDVFLLLLSVSLH